MTRTRRRSVIQSKPRPSSGPPVKQKLQPSPGPRDLPPCEGPKLHAFPIGNASIEWMERIDEESNDSSSSGGPQGWVFKVKIGSKVYAMKLFKFFDPEDTRRYWGYKLDKQVTKQTIAYHTDPFFAECRAYGRILEAEEQGLLKRQFAIPCRGYLYLSEEDSRIVRDKGLDFGEDAHADPRRIRAIVKDLASTDPGVEGNAGKILKGIRRMNKLQIYNQDIRIDNFKDGQLIDFGSSCTEPHCYISHSLDELEVSSTKAGDLRLFDYMIKTEGIKTDVRAVRNNNYTRKLRSCSRK